MKLIQKQAIKHYDNMYKFAMAQPKNNFPNDLLMEDAIGKSWYATDCSYCKKYFDHRFFKCVQCPLNLSTCKFPSECCGGLWGKMNHARTWKTWIKYNRLIRKFIEVHG